MAAPQYVYTMKKLSKAYPGGKQVLKDLHLSFLPDAKIGVVGVNGSGKSTLLKIMAGLDKEFTGEAWAAEGVRVGYLAQEPQLDPSKDVLGNAMEGVAEKKAMLDRYNDIAMNYSDETADEMAKLQDIIDGQNLWDLDAQVTQALAALNCPPPDADVSKLSGGEKRRVALVALLLSRPDILLLDEPTNHLDAETTAWLQHYLEDYPGCVILVTHDRYFLDSITQWTLELERGQGVPYKGSYSAWLEQKAKRVAQESSEEAAKQRLMQRELEWIRASPKARQAKSKARVTAYEKLADEAGKGDVGRAQIQIPMGPRLGGLVIEADHIKKAFGSRVLINELDFKLPPGGIVGVIGPNGAGKTTLFRMIIGQDKPDAGEFRVGETVKLGYVDQSRDALDPKKNVWEEISGGLDQIMLGKREVPSRAYLGWFNFKGADQQKKVGQLSGGERNRVHLAKMLKEGGNLILLDEPTNDLDVETLSSLEAALEDFPGCAVIITHDRFFLDRLATHILAFEGDGHVEWFEGNFQAYEEDKLRRLGAAAADTPKAKFARFARVNAVLVISGEEKFLSSEMFNETSTEGLSEEVEGNDEGDILISEGSTVSLEKNDRSIRELYLWYKDHELNLHPDWQRHYVWDYKRASILIESIFMGIPIPVIYLSQTADGKYEVIDGVQRMTSVFRYLSDEFPLSGLALFKDLNGKKSTELPDDRMRQLRNYTFRTFELSRNTTPDLLFLIFERLNTGGLKLNEMEIRNCIFRGSLNAAIKRFTENTDFKDCLGVRGFGKRMEDRSLVLRFLAFHQRNHRTANQGLKDFLNRFFQDNRDAGEDAIKLFEKSFNHSMRCSKTVFGQYGFRLRKKSGRDSVGEWGTRPNAAVFQVIATSFADKDAGIITKLSDAILGEHPVDVPN